MLPHRNKLKPYILLIPCTLYLFFIVCTGLGAGVLQSFGIFNAIGMTHITFDYYKTVLNSYTFLNSLQFSLHISLWSSVISVFAGFAISIIILNFKNRGKDFVRIFRIPISVPHIVVVLMMITLLGKTGFLSRLAILFFPKFDTGFFSRFIFDKSGIGIILVYLWKEIPFIALTAHSVLAQLDKQLGITAQNLGANYFQTIVYILLPLTVPTIFSSFIIIFAYSFGAYEVPLLIGPTIPKALPVQAFIEYTNPLLENRPYAMAYSILNLVFSFSALLIFFLLYACILSKGKTK